MATSSSSPPGPHPTISSSSSDGLEVNKELERMIEDMESMTVHLTCMAYDMVALRTNPELVASMQKLKDAFNKCKTSVLGDQQPETNSCSNVAQ